MPPKKKTDAGSDTTKFSWTAENDRTLLLLCFGRNTSPADYEKFIAALPAGANFQGVRQRVSKLRVEQRALYSEMGWELSAEAGVKAKARASPAGGGGKRKKGVESEGEEKEEEKVVKRGREKKVKTEGEEDVEVTEEIGEGEGEGVKAQEEVEELRAGGESS